MSQFYIATTSGNLPPDVPTTFVTDIEEDFDYLAGSGTSTPLANTEILTGDNGIQVVAHATDNNVMQFRFRRAEAITVGATTENTITGSLSNDSCITLQVLLTGFADNSDGVGGYTTATLKNVGGTTIVIDTGDLILNKDPSLPDCTFNIIASGADYIVTVTGQSGRTINWTVCLPGIVST